MTRLHVTVEMRPVYRSVRGTKLTKHAAYIGAAKALIADRCSLLTQKECAIRPPVIVDGEEFGAAVFCERKGPWSCRFHYETGATCAWDGEPNDDGGMRYYMRVLPRLVRYLKFVDSKGEVR
jgi:hypothetical protein